jgi:hypothetical protein
LKQAGGFARGGNLHRALRHKHPDDADHRGHRAFWRRGVEHSAFGTNDDNSSRPNSTARTGQAQTAGIDSETESQLLERKGVLSCRIAGAWLEFERFDGGIQQ